MEASTKEKNGDLTYNVHFHKQVRYKKTHQFLTQTLPKGSTILDIGTRNPFAEILEQSGYKVLNTSGQDLDDFPDSVKVGKTDAATAFEIFEHLLNPLDVLRSIEAPRLYASIPLSLWFAKAYKNPKEEWDRHFHEFEDWQFDWLLDKAGWKIVRREKWKSPFSWKHLGIRPILRSLTYRYYIVEAVRK